MDSDADAVQFGQTKQQAQVSMIKQAHGQAMSKQDITGKYNSLSQVTKLVSIESNSNPF